jgi:hypothetical protein
MEGGLPVRRAGVKNAVVKPSITSGLIWAGAVN